MPAVCSTDSLPKSPLFQYHSEDGSVEQRTNLSYARAKEVALSSGFDFEDILNLTPKFLSFCTHPVVTLDGGAVLLATIQLNLGIGTIAPYVHDRPDLRKLVEDLLAWRINLAYMLTEVAHGLDATNIETTATLCEDGSFDLHTPSDNAAKFMPPTLPCGETPRIGLVMAKLIIRGEDRGVRPFIVALNDGKEMCVGVTARELPTRVGSRAVGHSITQFNHVRLLHSSLLGKLETKLDNKKQLQDHLQRIAVGSLILTSCIVPSLKVSAFVGAKYSQRRHVTNHSGAKIPIISFRTQQVPILYALAQGFVMDSFFKTATSLFVSSKDVSMRNAITAVVKATMFHHWKKTGVTIADRCGAQGMFGFNQLASLEMELRGASIAEGDVLVLCIRLASELILGRYSLPPASHPESPLTRHEAGLLEECRVMLSEMGGNHRSPEFNNLVLPRCLPLVEAIGFRMAWEAALAHKVPPALIKLYETGAIGSDLAWYIEHTDISRDAFARGEAAALSEVLEGLDGFLDAAEVESSAVAAMLSDESWKRLVSSLPLYEGKAAFNPFQPILAKA
ncbi:acyl-CoA dehydrogenase NM domain-like protein [Phlebopus sp. FC_14]|nr:acyl-CoA dehydrogenase NM domain-like protein [Phlebopus sp. FC_14]